MAHYQTCRESLLANLTYIFFCSPETEFVEQRMENCLGQWIGDQSSSTFFEGPVERKAWGVIHDKCLKQLMCMLNSGRMTLEPGNGLFCHFKGLELVLFHGLHKVKGWHVCYILTASSEMDNIPVWRHYAFIYSFIHSFHKYLLSPYHVRIPVLRRTISCTPGVHSLQIYSSKHGTKGFLWLLESVPWALCHWT